MEAKRRKPLDFLEFRDVVDHIAQDAGCRFVEQFMLLELVLSIDGTDATAGKILDFMHKCNEMQPEHQQAEWISERIPKTFKGLKRKVRERLIEINESDGSSKAGETIKDELFTHI